MALIRKLPKAIPKQPRNAAKANVALIRKLPKAIPKLPKNVAKVNVVATKKLPKAQLKLLKNVAKVNAVYRFLKIFKKSVGFYLTLFFCLFFFSNRSIDALYLFLIFIVQIPYYNFLIIYKKQPFFI